MTRAAVFLVALLCMNPPERTAASLPLMYRAIRPQLRASAVPVLLPVPIPPAIGPVRSVTVIAAGPSGFYVGFSPVAHCAGALACAFFHIAGYPDNTRTDRSYRRERPVRLPDRTRGFFRPKDCSGASCTEASLTFERHGAVYELDAKVPRDNLTALKSAYRNLRSLH